jgi:hypothetical protein
MKLVTREGSSPCIALSDTSNFYLGAFYIESGTTETAALRRRSGGSDYNLAASSGFSTSLGNYRCVRFAKAGGNLENKVFSDNWETELVSLSATDTSLTATGIGLRYVSDNIHGLSESYVDWIRVRKYIAVEPSFLSADAEESLERLLVTIRVVPNPAVISTGVVVAAETIRLITLEPFYDYYVGVLVDTRRIRVAPSAPSVPPYSIAGTVTEQGNPVARTVRLYRRSTGELVASTTSSAVDGSFEFADIAGDVYFVVAFDDDAGDDYNALIFDRIKAVQVV